MSDDLIPNQIITLITLVVGLLCVFASNIDLIGGLFSIIAAVLASIWGTNSLRKVGKYSLGTGIPSIVYMLTAVSLVSYLSAIFLSAYVNQYLFPILSILIATIISWIISLICKKIFNIQVEILSKSFISISLSAVLLLIAMSTLITQSYDPLVIYESVIQNSLIILLMIMTVMIIQNPYNACMGPNEEQYRTLSLAGTNAFMMLIIISFISMLNNQYWIIYMIISLIGWFIFFRQYIKYTKQQAVSIKRFGLWPSSDKE